MKTSYNTDNIEEKSEDETKDLSKRSPHTCLWLLVDPGLKKIDSLLQIVKSVS